MVASPQYSVIFQYVSTGRSLCLSLCPQTVTLQCSLNVTNDEVKNSQIKNNSKNVSFCFPGNRQKLEERKRDVELNVSVDRKTRHAIYTSLVKGGPKCFERGWSYQN